MSRLAKFILTILGGVLPAFLRNYLDRVEADGGATVDRDHIVEVYEDTNPYNPTLIQSCESGKATVAYSLFAFDDVDDFELRVVADGGTNESTRQDALFAQHLWRNDLHNNASLVVPCASHKAGTLYAYQPTVEPDTTLLDYYTGSAAAYSLRSLSASTTNVVKVRRSSDDTEQDFTAAEITNGTLLTFVNEDVDIYTSDFSSTEDLSEFKGTDVAGQSVGGVDNAYKFTLSGGSGDHFAYRNIHEVGQSYEVSFDVYIPSSNSAVDGVLFTLFGAQDIVSTSTTDEWVTLTATYTANYANGNFYATDGGSKTVNGDGDVFYLKNIVVTQTTADGFVTTWYDQSGNTNNATQATAANQPKIVSSGSLVTENGNAAIDFDGVDDFFGFPSGLVVNNHSIFATIKQDNQSGAITGISGTGGYYLRYASNDPDSLLWYIPDTTNGVLSFVGETSSQNLITAIKGVANVYSYVNGNNQQSRASTGNLTSAPSAIGRYAASNYFRGNVQEFILYASDQSANRTGIEANINDYYNIYP